MFLPFIGCFFSPIIFIVLLKKPCKNIPKRNKTSGRQDSLSSRQQNQDMLDDMAAKAELEHGLQSSLGLELLSLFLCDTFFGLKKPLLPRGDFISIFDVIE